MLGFQLRETLGNDLLRRFTGQHSAGHLAVSNRRLLAGDPERGVECGEMPVYPRL